MNEEEKEKFEELSRKVNEIYDFVSQAKAGTLPVNDNTRISNGIGFIGRTSDTTPGGAIIVNSPQGPIKILIV